MNISLTLRDYLSYIFAGTVLLLAIFFFDKSCNHSYLWNTLKNSTKLISLILLIGGYYLGYLSNVIMTYLYGAPYKDTLKNENMYGLDITFIQNLKKKLNEKWGKNFYNDTNSNILYLCWQDIQSTEHRGIAQIYRIISLRNFCVSSILPLGLLGFSLWISGHFIIAPIVFFMLYIMNYAKKNQEKYFVQSIYRIWYVQHEKFRLKG